MYESYSRQTFPNEKYRDLLGNVICVFNSNNSFIIENVLSYDDDWKYNWYQLIDEASGNLTNPIKGTVTKYSDKEISILSDKIVAMRNRIVLSFQISTESGEHILATKTKKGLQFRITKDYLYDFIKKNDELSILLNELRGY